MAVLLPAANMYNMNAAFFENCDKSLYDFLSKAAESPAWIALSWHSFTFPRKGRLRAVWYGIYQVDDVPVFTANYDNKVFMRVSVAALHNMELFSSDKLIISFMRPTVTSAKGNLTFYKVFSSILQTDDQVEHWIYAVTSSAVAGRKRTGLVLGEEPVFDVEFYVRRTGDRIVYPRKFVTLDAFFSGIDIESLCKYVATFSRLP